MTIKEKVLKAWTQECEVEIQCKPPKGFEGSFTIPLADVKLDSILWLLGIPDWSIDAESVYMNWRDDT